MRKLLLVSVLGLSACGQRQPSQAYINASQILAHSPVNDAILHDIGDVNKVGPDGMTDYERHLVGIYKTYGGRSMKICRAIAGPITASGSGENYANCLDARGPLKRD